MSLMSFLPSILANVFHKPATRLYPIAIRPPFERTRGSIDITIEDCIFCGQCSRKCPTHAIDTSRNDKFWNINRLRCIQCGACVECCPKKCLRMAGKQPDASTGSQVDTFKVMQPESTDA